MQVKGLDENIMSEDGTVDLFTESRYECMRRITDIAMSAVLQHVCQASVPEFPLRYIMVMRLLLVVNLLFWSALTLKFFQQIWLNSYRNLFSDPCTVCGKHLDSEALPPLWRDYRTPAACHDSCRPWLANTNFQNLLSGRRHSQVRAGTDASSANVVRALKRASCRRRILWHSKMLGWKYCTWNLQRQCSTYVLSRPIATGGEFGGSAAPKFSGAQNLLYRLFYTYNTT